MPPRHPGLLLLCVAVTASCSPADVEHRKGIEVRLVETSITGFEEEFVFEVVAFEKGILSGKWSHSPGSWGLHGVLPTGDQKPLRVYARYEPQTGEELLTLVSEVGGASAADALSSGQPDLKGRRFIRLASGEGGSKTDDCFVPVSYSGVRSYVPEDPQLLENAGKLSPLTWIFLPPGEKTILDGRSPLDEEREGHRLSFEIAWEPLP